MFEKFLISIWDILLDLSPSLLVGLLIAGIIHQFLPPNMVRRKLSGKNFKSVLGASIVGVPMPLCSCGVVPTAIGLKNEGASKSAATSFLISTPQTGVDSILVSASFLGWPFAIFKVVAAFVTGLIGGTLVNMTEKKTLDLNIPVLPADENPDKKGNPIIQIINYAVFDLLGSIYLWLIGGILVAGLITLLVPDGYLASTEWVQGISGMLLMLLIAMPLYICTTGSVPIAASLIASGMPLGTALVFLMAGPATNMATMGAIYRGLGKRVLIIYLSTVAVMSILFGLGFDWILGDIAQTNMMHHHADKPWYVLLSTAIFIFLLTLLSGKKLMSKLTTNNIENTDSNMVLKVGGMSCGHCVASVKKSLEEIEGVEEATPDLNSKTVTVKGEELNKTALKEAILAAGFTVD